ncbi:MAG: P1 family peptidase, partial [Stackebrandtia sp.]
VRGRDRARPGGLGVAAMRAENLTVFAAVAVNSFGVVDVDGGELASMVALARPKGVGDPSLFTNTVIGVVATNARLDKLGCLIAAQGAHDGLARAVAPPHSRVDGDAFIAAATGKVEADVDAVRLLAMSAVDRAIRSAGTTRPR